MSIQYGQAMFECGIKQVGNSKEMLVELQIHVVDVGLA